VPSVTATQLTERSKSPVTSINAELKQAMSNGTRVKSIQTPFGAMFAMESTGGVYTKSIIKFGAGDTTTKGGSGLEKCCIDGERHNNNKKT
jgi:hypothetical protein